MLDAHAKLLYIALISVASEENNKTPNSAEFLSKRLAIELEVVHAALPPLVECGLVSVHGASKTLAEKTEALADSPPLEEKSKRIEKNKPHSLACAKRVLNFLNEQSGRNFDHVPSNTDLIVARLNECAAQGYPNPIKIAGLIIMRKANEQGWDNKFLRPKTLFSKQNWWTYCGELGQEVKNDGTDLPAMR